MGGDIPAPELDCKPQEFAFGRASDDTYRSMVGLRRDFRFHLVLL